MKRGSGTRLGWTALVLVAGITGTWVWLGGGDAQGPPTQAMPSAAKGAQPEVDPETNESTADLLERRSAPASPPSLSDDGLVAGRLRFTNGQPVVRAVLEVVFLARQERLEGKADGGSVYASLGAVLEETWSEPATGSLREITEELRPSGNDGVIWPDFSFGIPSEATQDGSLKPIGFDLARTNERGLFEVRSDVPCERIWTRLVQGAHWEEKDLGAIEIGTSALDVEIEPLGAIAIELDFPKAYERFGFEVSVEPANGAPDAKLRYEYDDLGLLPRLQPGAYTVAVHGGIGQPSVLASIVDVFVEPARTTMDPRLLPLRQELSTRTLSIEVLDTRGERTPLALASLRSAASRSETDWHGLMHSGRGRFEVEVPAGKVDLLVGSLRHRVQLLHNVDDDVTVQLELPFEVPVVLGDAELDLPEGVRLQATLAPLEENGSDRRGLEAVAARPVDVSLDGGTTLHARFEGPHEVVLSLFDARRAPVRTPALPRSSAWTNDGSLLTLPGVSRVELSIDHEEVRALLARD